MESNNIVVSSKESQSPESASDKKQNKIPAPLLWWYRHFAPTEPPANTNLFQREKARHGKVASLAIPAFMLFVFTLLAQAIIDKNLAQIIALLIGLGTSVLVLYLNRRGFVESAGILILILQYAGATFSMLNYPSGLTIDHLSLLDFSIIPDMLALAFFPANSLFLVVGLNIIQTGVIVVYGPHDVAIAHLLHTAPFQIFSHVYALQLITAITLYVWARSTELAIERADRAEELAAFGKREKERQERQLEQKRQLDAGIQQILQTHVAVANGDLKVRAPLTQDHVLWQVAAALNNLIARLQSLSQTERELRQQLWKENEHGTNHHPKIEPGKAPHPKTDTITHRALKPDEREKSPSPVRTKGNPS